MALNPQKRAPLLDNPVDRSNPINEPDYMHEEGYNPFSLSQPVVGTYRYGEVSPISSYEVIPGDRHQLAENFQIFMDEIQKRVLSKMSQYVDYFHVPYRNIWPINYDKIIVNPVKGDDVPLFALPQIPLAAFIRWFLEPFSEVSMTLSLPGNFDGRLFFNSNNLQLNNISSIGDFNDFYSMYLYSGDIVNNPDIRDVYMSGVLALGRLLYVANMLSRGQLLDNLDCSFDDVLGYEYNVSLGKYFNKFQEKIDQLFNYFSSLVQPGSILSFDVYGCDLSDSEDALLNSTYVFNLPEHSEFVVPSPYWKVCYFSPVNSDTGLPYFDLQQFRAAIYECFDKGYFPLIVARFEDSGFSGMSVPMSLDDTLKSIFDYFSGYFSEFDQPDSLITDADELFDGGYINPARLVAYQQCIAEYQSNDHVDNVFSADLWMQNMRAIMFPSMSNLTTEPTFKYNGVDYEYDMFTTGGFVRAWFSSWAQSVDGAFMTRALPFISNLFFQRRSLRYRDYFASARPNMLAVGDLEVQVNPNGNVNPIDMSRGIVLQRFWNAVNRWGMKAKNYMAGLFGVVPSNLGCAPAWIITQHSTFADDKVTNQSGSDTQGRVSTNLVSSVGDNMTYDIFIDDYGVIIGTVRFETQAYYPAGVDRSYRHNDRFSLFNPMLQDTGDQEIRRDELTGDIRSASRAAAPFGYATRYAEYKQLFARCRGGFVNDLPASVFIYPYVSMFKIGSGSQLTISPDFIRERPMYLDQYKSQLTGVSPAQYYHFTGSVSSNHQSARKIKKWPGIL